jgi:hypothetical protein
MRLRVSACILLCLGCLEASAAAQQPSSPAPTPPIRDLQAIGTIQHAISALGGSNAVSQIQSVIAQGSILSGPNVADPSGNIILEDLFTAQIHEFRDSFQSSTVTQSFVSGHGSPGMSSSGHVHSFTPHMALFRTATHIPIVVLSQMLANPSCNIEYAGTTTINGQAAIQVHLHIDTDILQQTFSVQDWYFDPATGLPLRLEYRLPGAGIPLQFASAAVDFSDFRPVQGVLFPFHLLSYRSGFVRSTISFSSITLNGPIASSDFDPPSAVAQ